jgi:hypothetical protein
MPVPDDAASMLAAGIQVEWRQASTIRPHGAAQRVRNASSLSM